MSVITNGCFIFHYRSLLFCRAQGLEKKQSRSQSPIYRKFVKVMNNLCSTHEKVFESMAKEMNLGLSFFQQSWLGMVDEMNSKNIDNVESTELFQRVQKKFRNESLDQSDVEFWSWDNIDDTVIVSLARRATPFTHETLSRNTLVPVQSLAGTRLIQQLFPVVIMKIQGLLFASFGF